MAHQKVCVFLVEIIRCLADRMCDNWPTNQPLILTRSMEISWLVASQVILHMQRESDVYQVHHVLKYVHMLTPCTYHECHVSM